MAELDVEGRKYRTGKLNAFKQFHLMRKLLPLFSGMGESLSQMPATVGSGEGQFWHSLSPIAQAVADMSDDDSEWIIKTCLAAVTVFNGRNWVPVATPTGELMFDDIDLSQMLQLAFGVIQENLGNFFPGALPNGSDGEAQASPLPMSQ